MMAEEKFQKEYDERIGAFKAAMQRKAAENETCGGLFRPLKEGDTGYLLCVDHELFISTREWYRNIHNIPNAMLLSDGQRFEIEALCLDCLIRRRELPIKLKYKLRNMSFPSDKERREYYKEAATYYAREIKLNYLERHSAPEERETSAIYEYDKLVERFDDFFSSYPNKKRRKEALAEWQQLKPDDRVQEYMIVSLQYYIDSPEWRSGAVPSCDTWIRRRMWEVPPAYLTEQEAG